MTMRMLSIKPTTSCLGGTQFRGLDRTFSVMADAGKGNDMPIELYVGANGHRSMIDLSIEEAETLVEGIAKALELRKAAESSPTGAVDPAATPRAVVARNRAFFADADGALETA